MRGEAIKGGGGGVKVGVLPVEAVKKREGGRGWRRLTAHLWPCSACEIRLWPSENRSSVKHQ